ncbi:hypothetical protein [Methanothrix soehngenii]|uniref:hypothetical protein n=1 Tax=Methanothrix soehngenii TaxID=2223 RepID=UPI00300D9D71
MKRYAISALALAISMIAMALGSSVCDNAPCEPVINATMGEEFLTSPLIPQLDLSGGLNSIPNS